MAVTILVVDDDQDLLVLNSMYLKLAGFKVITCKNGKEAIEILQQQSPDLIVIDLIMPIMDGTAFLAWFRQEAKYDIPIIILSAVKKSEVAQNIASDDRVEILQKPFNPKELIKRITTILG